MALLHALLTTPRVDLELDADGCRLALAATNNLSVLKNPYIASGLKLDLDLPQALAASFAFGILGAVIGIVVLRRASRRAASLAVDDPGAAADELLENFLAGRDGGSVYMGD